MLLALLLATVGAGWVAVSMGLAGQLPSRAAPADQAAASWQDRTAGITVEASAFGMQLTEAGRGAATALGGAAGSLATSASPAAKRTIEAALDLLRDPLHGPIVPGCLGLAAGLAFGVLLGRRRGETPRAQEPPTPASPPPPVRALSEPTPPPTPTTPAPLAVTLVAPLATPLPAGTVAHEAVTAPEPPPPPAEAMQAAADARSGLIAAIATIFQEEARLADAARGGDTAGQVRADAA